MGKNVNLLFSSKIVTNPLVVNESIDFVISNIFTFYERS
jgi:hypothetical protein